MICEKCGQEIDNSKGGFTTLANGKKYHGQWIDCVVNEDGTETITMHEPCTV